MLVRSLVLGQAFFPEETTMLKSILAIVFGFLCLVIVAAGSSEAKGRSGGGHRSAHRSHGRRPQHVQQHHKHKHHHKHKSMGDADGGGSDGGSAEAEEAEEAGETEAAVGATEEAEETEASVYGVEITALYKGTAAKEGLEIGDIILSFNGIATPNFEALASAVARSGSQAQVLVVRGEDGERETITLFPKEGRIGLSGEGVRVSE
jgi:hypothetical protein